MFTKQTIAKRGKLNEAFRAVFSIAPHHNSDRVDLARAAFRFSSKFEHFNNCPFRTKKKKLLNGTVFSIFWLFVTTIMVRNSKIRRNPEVPIKEGFFAISYIP